MSTKKKDTSIEGITARVIKILNARPGAPKVQTADDDLLKDLRFTEAGRRNFASKVNKEFKDLQITVERPEMDEAGTVRKLVRIVKKKADAAGGEK